MRVSGESGPARLLHKCLVCTHARTHIITYIHIYALFICLWIFSQTSRATGQRCDRAQWENPCKERHASIQSQNLIDGLEAHPAKRDPFGNVSVANTRREQPNSLLSVSIQTWRRQQTKCFICQRVGVRSHSSDCLPLISRRGFLGGGGCASFTLFKYLVQKKHEKRSGKTEKKKPFYFAGRISAS